jgi:hypothetical protein
VTVRLLFITNLFFWARQLTSIATGRFSIVWGIKSAGNVRNDGRTRANSVTLAMRWCTLLCHSSNLWSLRTWLWPPTLPAPLIWPWWFLLLSENETAPTRASFPRRPWNPRAFADCHTRDSKLSLLGALPAVERTLDPGVGRGLLWKEQLTN